jgi:DNA-binding MarR family transcriptional regulator
MRDITELVMQWQDVTEAYDEMVGEKYGLSSTERRCLSVLYHGPRTAGALAFASSLTPAAVTALADRLEARGFVKRTRSAEDRRKVTIELGPVAHEITERYYAPLAREAEHVLAEFSEEELAVVRRFLAAAIDLQERQLEAVKANGST